MDNIKELDYDRVNNNEYLNFFICEVLRMHPIAIQAISRECSQNTIVCDYNIQKDPEDPQEFLPERYSIRRHPIAYTSFGQGPRNCIGMRFGLMEIELCLTRLLYRHNILIGDKTEKNFIIREPLVMQPDAVYIKLDKRKLKF